MSNDGKCLFESCPVYPRGDNEYCSIHRRKLNRSEPEERNYCGREGCEVEPKNGAEFCYRHKKVPRNKAGLEKVNEKRKKKPEFKSSYFHVTISTNKSAENQEDIDLIDQLNNYLFDERNIEDFIIDKNGKELDIAELEVHAGAIEESDKYGRLHFHSVVSVPKHSNQLAIDVEALNEFLADTVGSACYVNVVAKSDPAAIWKAYGLKTVE